MASVLSKITDFVFPRICPLCGTHSDREGRFICWSCLEKLQVTSVETLLCTKCGAVPKGKVDSLYICDRCKETRPHYDALRSAAPFSGKMRELIHNFKYKKSLWLEDDFADLLESTMRSFRLESQIDVIIPVPLHDAKFIIRQYNQASILALALSKRLSIKIDETLITRARDTSTQTHLSSTDRAHNVKSAFKVLAPELVASRRILVVDDVITTGATINEIAIELKSAGASSVYGISLGRA